MNKVLMVLGGILAVGVGGLLAYASFFIGIFILLNPDGDGAASIGEWVIVLSPVFMAVLSFVAAGFLFYHANK